MVIHEPTDAMSKMLADLDLITDAINVDLYRIYLGNRETCPDGYDFIVNEIEFYRPIEEQLDYIFSFESVE